MKDLYEEVSFKTSEITTRKYSTSFSHGIRLFSRRFHKPIYAIYGFVRLADEIVDTFHGYNQAQLLDRFVHDTYTAIEENISLNPILHSFQKTVRQYNIERELIQAFFDSMKMDLEKQTYNRELYERYILGSAEVVGLMCLRVFVEGDNNKYEQLKHSAMRLGSAFQKINFLRDIKADTNELGRMYFPEGIFNESSKMQIQEDIEKDFADGLKGIRQLPAGARLGVYIAYRYYYYLFKKIKRLSPDVVLSQRVRIPDSEKYYIMAKTFMRTALNMIT